MGFGLMDEYGNDDRKSINEYCDEINTWATKQGFWTDHLDWTEPEAQLSKLMLIVTEVAEAAEAVRQEDGSNLPEEVADIAIRLFDFAWAYNIDLEAEINKKMEVNKGRPFKHGKRA